MSYDVKVFYKECTAPESLTVESSECIYYGHGMLMLTDTEMLTIHVPIDNIERVEIKEIHQNLKDEEDQLNG